MSNGELFIKENPNIEFKLNGSCVWIYFYDYNHYTMPIEWWEQEISLFDKIRAEIEEVFCISVITDKPRTPMEVKTEILQIIDKYREGEQEC